MRRLVLGAAACGLLALIFAVAGCQDEPATVTPGPATASLELVDEHYTPPATRAEWSREPSVRPEGYSTLPPREVRWAVFLGDVWLIAAYSKKGGLELSELSADLSRGRPVTGFPAPGNLRRSITVVPDERYRKAVVATEYTRDPRTGEVAVDVAVLDIPHARLNTLYRAPGSSQPGGDPMVWAGGSIAVAHGRAVTLIDPATRAVRELYREEPSEPGLEIVTLSPSPLGTWIAIQKHGPILWGESSQRAGRTVMVIDVAAGKGVPVALDSRRSYYHGVVKWESEDSLQFWASEGDGKASLYRAKLRPAHADSR